MEGGEGPKPQLNETKINLHETPEKSFSNLGFLSWFSSNPNRRPSWLNTGQTKWFAARQLLSTLDWRKSLPTAIWQKDQFDKDRSKLAINKSEKNERLYAFNQAFYNTFNSEETKVFTEKTSLLANTFVNFGPQMGVNDKTLRVYINPKVDLASYTRVLSSIKEIFVAKGVTGQIKGNTEAMYKASAEGKFVPSDDENKVVLYLDATNGDNITKLLEGLADSDIFEDLEDSGEWALEAKIPVAKGVSMVEATGQSWDTKDSQGLAVIQQKGRLLYREKDFRKIVQTIARGPRGANLGNAERVPLMPGLLANTPLLATA